MRVRPNPGLLDPCVSREMPGDPPTSSRICFTGQERGHLVRSAAITAISLASLALGCSTLPAAFANFDFGDTRVEVRNKTEQNVDSGDFVTADSVRVGVHEFRVSFSFRRDRLWGIWLSGPEVEGEPRSGPEDYRESILDLYDILHARYGEPIDPSGRRPPRASLEVQFRTLGSRTARRSGCSTHWRWKTERKVVALSSCRRKEKAVAGKPGDSRLFEITASTGEVRMRS